MRDEKIAFAIAFAFAIKAHAEITIKIMVVVGDELNSFEIKESSTPKDEFNFLNDKAQAILKMDSHQKRFCFRDYIELTVVDNNKSKNIIGCLSTKGALIKKLANIATAADLMGKKKQF